MATIGAEFNTRSQAIKEGINNKVGKALEACSGARPARVMFSLMTAFGTVTNAPLWDTLSQALPAAIDPIIPVATIGVILGLGQYISAKSASNSSQECDAATKLMIAEAVQEALKKATAEQKPAVKTDAENKADSDWIRVMREQQRFVQPRKKFGQRGRVACG